MIGSSISFCIKDIIEGRIMESDVERIIAGTKVEHPVSWLKVAAGYQENYWQVAPKEALRILYRLLSEGKIEQPRVTGGTVPWGTRHWWDTREEFEQHCGYPVPMDDY